MSHHRTYRTALLSLILALAVVIFSACAQTKPSSDDSVVGSGIFGTAAYPHPDDWAQPTVHGDWVNRNDVESCLGCHKGASDVPEETPTCASCHPLFPHTDAWGQGVNHGVYAEDNGLGVCATQCHGTDLDGGLSGVSCTSCHTYPHATNWASGDVHGTYVNDNGYGDCATDCHGTDLQGGTSGVSCTSCHAQFPHLPGWSDAANHGAYVVDNGPAGCETACHGADLAGGTSGVACTSCHPDYPHTDPNWTALGNASVHVNTFTTHITDGDTTACQECHGANYDREINGMSCLTCHPDGVTHTSGWSTADHGPYYSARYDSSSTTANCWDCHGSPVPFTDSDTITTFGCSTCHSSAVGTSTQTKASLAAQSDCYACHWSYPHMSYDLPGTVSGTGIHEWQNPAASGPHPIPDATLRMGHLWYLMRNPLLVDANDTRPWGGMRIGDPNHPAAVSNTCGGDTTGQCHICGNRSVPHTDIDSLLCSQYCHWTP